MTTVILADDYSDSSDGDDYYDRRRNAYRMITGPSAWWRRLTGQDPQYERTTVGPERPHRRRRRGRYRPTRTQFVTLRENYSSESFIPYSSSEESVRGRRGYITRSWSPYRGISSHSPPRRRFYSPSPSPYSPRSGYRHVPRGWYRWGWGRPRDRTDDFDDFYRSRLPPPEPPRPAPPLPVPPMPPPSIARPSQLRQLRGDRYVESQESRYRDEYIKLRRENIEEMDYEADYMERMPDWRKGSFQYRDRMAREDRLEELQEILRGARTAAERDEMHTETRPGVL